MNRRHFMRSSVAAAVAASFPASRGLAAILSGSMSVDRDIDAFTGDGAEVTLKKAAVQELGDGLRGDRQMVARMISDFKTVPVQCANLLPGHVVLFVLLEGKAFGDVKRGAEAEPLHNRTRDREM